MIQVMTIRQQIELALKRVPNLDTFLLNQLRIELHREFDEIARQMGYVKADTDMVQVSRLKLENWLRRIQHIKQLACNENRVSTLGIADNLAAELTAALEGNYGQG